MSASEERLKKILKEKGLQVTNQRVLILQTLKDASGQHLTAEEIYSLVKTKYPKIGLATVYRTIQLLLELNLVDRINLDDGIVRYEIGQVVNNNRHRHHHLICQKCGVVISFEVDLLETLENTIEDTLGFKVCDHEVKFFGYCKDCSELEKNKHVRKK